MRTRDGRKADLWTCCGSWYAEGVRECPQCGHRDPHGAPAENQNSAEHNPLGSEAAMQAQVESWLRHAGYWPRSPKFLNGDRPPRGWFVHVHQAQGNPILLDLLILDFARGWYEIELKTENGRMRVDQSAILAAQPGHSTLCRFAQDAIDAIRLRFDLA